MKSQDDKEQHQITHRRRRRAMKRKKRLTKRQRKGSAIFVDATVQELERNMRDHVATRLAAYGIGPSEYQDAVRRVTAMCAP